MMKFDEIKSEKIKFGKLEIGGVYLFKWNSQSCTSPYTIVECIKKDKFSEEALFKVLHDFDESNLHFNRGKIFRNKKSTKIVKRLKEEEYIFYLL